MEVILHLHHILVFLHLRKDFELSFTTCDCCFIFSQNFQGNLFIFFNILSLSNNSEDSFPNFVNDFIFFANNFAAINVIVPLLISNLSLLLVWFDFNIKIISKHIKIILLLLFLWLDKSVRKTNILSDFNFLPLRSTILWKFLKYFFPLLNSSLDLSISAPKPLLIWIWFIHDISIRNYYKLNCNINEYQWRKWHSASTSPLKIYKSKQILFCRISRSSLSMREERKLLPKINTSKITKWIFMPAFLNQM